MSRNNRSTLTTEAPGTHAGRMAGKASKRVLARKAVAKETSRKAAKTAVSKSRKRPSIRLAERIGMVNERKVLWKGKAAYLFSAKA